MTVKVGDRIPSVKLNRLGADGMEEVDTQALFAGKTVVLFSVPGAFTPTCSAKHLPGFVEHHGALVAKGVDSVICTAVNDPFVMKAWGEANGVTGKVDMLPDGNGELAAALGLTLDGSGFGLGMRGQRFALVARDGTVTALHVEEPGAYRVSSAEYVLGEL